jgi:uncharacterized membrane protein
MTIPLIGALGLNRNERTQTALPLVCAAADALVVGSIAYAKAKPIGIVKPTALPVVVASIDPHRSAKRNERVRAELSFIGAVATVFDYRYNLLLERKAL